MSDAPVCPTCGQPASPQEKSFPFCSPRCKKVDLYRWVTGDLELEALEEPLPPPPPAPPTGLEVEEDD